VPSGPLEARRFTTSRKLQSSYHDKVTCTPYLGFITGKGVCYNSSTANLTQADRLRTDPHSTIPMAILGTLLNGAGALLLTHACVHLSRMRRIICLMNGC
jgi:hypothetical protein